MDSQGHVDRAILYTAQAILKRLRDSGQIFGFQHKKTMSKEEVPHGREASSTLRRPFRWMDGLLQKLKTTNIHLTHTVATSTWEICDTEAKKTAIFVEMRQPQ